MLVQSGCSFGNYPGSLILGICAYCANLLMSTAERYGTSMKVFLKTASKLTARKSSKVRALHAVLALPNYGTCLENAWGDRPHAFIDGCGHAPPRSTMGTESCSKFPPSPV